MKGVLAFTLGIEHPSSRLRVEAYSKHLARLGWRLQLYPFHKGIGKEPARGNTWWARLRQKVERALRTRRAVAALNSIHPHQPVIISRELPVSRQPFLKAPNPLALDIDDALYLGPGRERLLELCRRAEIVVCGNQTISNALSGYCRRCEVIPTVVETRLYNIKRDHRVRGRMRIGWLGSSMSMGQTLIPWLEEMDELRALADFELAIISDEPPDLPRGREGTVFLKWSPETERSIAERMDAGIMPLRDEPFQAAKCGAKLLQYMAAGIPVIASPIGANREIVNNDVTGLWASTIGEWRNALGRLAHDEPLRERLGRAGRARVENHFSAERWAARWAELLNEISGSGH